MGPLDLIGDIIINVLKALYESLIEPFVDMANAFLLVFDDSLIHYTFTQDETEIINGLVQFTQITAIVIVVFGIIYGGMKISSSGINPANRNAAIEFGKSMMVVAIILYNIVFLYDVVLYTNSAIVSFFRSFTSESNLFVDQLRFDDMNIFEKGVGWLFIGLILLGLTIWLNFYYMMRKLTLMILMILGPFFIALYLFPQLRGITFGWFRELVATTLVQSVHAAMFVILAYIGQTTDSILALLFMYITFIPASESIRRLLNLQSEMNDNISRFASMTGMAGLMGMAGAIKGAVSGQGVLDAMRGAARGVKNRVQGRSKTGGANTGAMKGTTSSADRMIRAGQITSKLGKASLGAAGAVVGMPMGPQASLTYSVLGARAGELAGGVGGRLGYSGASLGKEAFQKGVRGIKGGIDGYRLSQNAHKLDEQSLDNMSKLQADDWAKLNEEGFKNQYRQMNPKASESEILQAWNKAKDDKYAQIKKQNQNMLDPRKQTKNEAYAPDLEAQIAKASTNQWARENKQQFLNDIKQQNPDISDDKAQKAWQKELSRKYKQNARLANKVKNDFTNGTGQGLVNKDDFANAFAAEKLKEDAKNNHMSDLSQQNLRGMTSQDIQEAIDQDAQKQQSRYAKMMKNSLSQARKQDYTTTNGDLNRDKIAEHTAQSMTNEWGNKYKESFKANMKQQNPQLTDDEIDLRWEEAQKQQHQIHLRQAKKAAESIDKQLAFKGDQLDSNYISSHMAQSMVKDWKQSAVAGIGAAKLATSRVGTPVKNNAGHVDINAVAHTQARQMLNEYNTPDQRQAFTRKFKQQQPNATDHQIEQAWQKNLSDQYQTYFNQAKQLVPNQYRGHGSKGQARALVDHMQAGVKGAYQASGVADIVQSFKNSIPVKYAVRTAQGVVVGGTKAGQNAMVENLDKNIFDQAGHYVKAVTSGVASGVKYGFQQAKTERIELKEQDAAQKHADFRNKVAYVGGVIGGVRGYQASSELASKINPYNKAINKQAYEVSELAQHAKKIVVQTPNGPRQRVADDAIQLVVDKDQSFVQMTNQNGERITVSKIGSGDANLRPGEVIYQDLQIQDNALVAKKIPGSNYSAYKKDSAGGKVIVNREINIEANELMANRRPASSNIRIQPLHDPYSSKVDAQQFTIKDIEEVSNNGQVTQVVEKDRSYLITTDRTGRQYRVSGYGQGDSSLSQNEVYYKDYQIKDGQIRPEVSELYTYQLSPQGERVMADYQSPVNARDLIPKPTNPRLERRRRMEGHRSRQGVW